MVASTVGIAFVSGKVVGRGAASVVEAVGASAVGVLGGEATSGAEKGACSLAFGISSGGGGSSSARARGKLRRRESATSLTKRSVIGLTRSRENRFVRISLWLQSILARVECRGLVGRLPPEFKTRSTDLPKFRLL